jgi:hypothetical protein
MIGRGDTDPLGKQKSSSQVMRRWKVSSYVDQPCMLIRPVDGRPTSRLTPITRRSLIRWVANKLGGVHIDADHLGSEAFYALDWCWDAIEFHGRGAHMAELLACSQALALSPDSRRFQEMVGRPR